MNFEQVSYYLEARFPTYLDILKSMVSTNSFTRNPQGVNTLGEQTADYFGALGLEAEFIQSVNPNYGKHLFLRSPSRPNTAVSPNKRPSIAIVSHLDTVFSSQEEQEQDFHFRLEDDRIYGPGSVDCKGGTVMAYMVLNAIQRHAPEIFEAVDWVVALDASEETLSADFGALCLSHIPSDAKACLVMEGGTPNPAAFPLVVSRKGHAEFRVEAEGRGAHAGNFHHQGANAVVQLAEVILKIANFTDYSEQHTFNVGVIRGGDATNRVPHHSEARVEMRAFSPQVFKSGIERMLTLDGSSTISSSDGFPCRVKVDLISSTNPWPVNPKTESLLALWTEAGKQLDIQVIPEARGGISDGNLLWQQLPILDGLGPAGMNAHCSERSADGSKDQEFALKSSFIPKALLNVAGIMKLVAE